MSVYDDIGGDEAIRGAVASLYRRVLADPTVAYYFEGSDLGSLRAHQRAFLTEALGGPHVFSGRSMADAHADLDITDEAFDTVVEHLIAALAEVGVGRENLMVVRETLEPLRRKIVTAQGVSSGR